MLVKELIEKLNKLIELGLISEDDLVFYHLPDEDEGSLDSLYPVNNVSSPNIKFDEFRKEDLDKLTNRVNEGVQIAFISTKIIKY